MRLPVCGTWFLQHPLTFFVWLSYLHSCLVPLRLAPTSHVEQIYKSHAVHNVEGFHPGEYFKIHVGGEGDFRH